MRASSSVQNAEMEEASLLVTTLRATTVELDGGQFNSEAEDENADALAVLLLFAVLFVAVPSSFESLLLKLEPST